MTCTLVEDGETVQRSCREVGEEGRTAAHLREGLRARNHPLLGFRRGVGAWSDVDTGPQSDDRPRAEEPFERR